MKNDALVFIHLLIVVKKVRFYEQRTGTSREILARLPRAGETGD